MSATFHIDLPKPAAALRVLLAAAILALSPWLAAQDTLVDDFSKPPEIEKRLAAARAEAAALPEDADPTLRQRLLDLVAVCQYHLSAVNIANKANEERDTAVQATAAWTGFPEAPPYPITRLDQIRDTLATLETAKNTSEVQLRIFAANLEAARNQLDEHQQAERRFADVSGTGSPEERLMAQREFKAEQVSSRIATEEIARLELSLAAQRAEIDLIRAKTQLAELQLKAVQDKTSFTQSDLDAILQQIAGARSQAVAAMDAASHSPQEPNPLLTWKVEFLDLEKNFWETRFTSLNAKQPAARKAALANLAVLKKQVDDWAKIARLRLEGGPAVGEYFDPAQLRESLQQIIGIQRRIGFATTELESDTPTTPIIDRITSALTSLWNMELYLAEETDIVDGRKIPIYRAVTLGKLIRLAFILTIGWLVLRFLSKRLYKLLSSRSQLPESTAEIARKWSFVIGLALLLLYGMNTVHIPLTAFAFLGGALAIGIGFGTQTLLKNFISGIILIFERPLKVGDVVEVAGITGRIRSIGIRASVIQHFDGIDTLIPNSTLLENEVTNWTFSNTMVRHSITVGVAYGSPTREVSHLLVSVAVEHGLVLDHPAPEVRFEDFGDNSLLFRLLFWLDTAKAQRDPLASDLRFMIDKALSEAGIAISFPQRDLHFDPDKPLRVELSRPPTSKPIASTP